MAGHTAKRIDGQVGTFFQGGLQACPRRTRRDVVRTCRSSTLPQPSPLRGLSSTTESARNGQEEVKSRLGRLGTMTIEGRTRSVVTGGQGARRGRKKALLVTGHEGLRMAGGGAPRARVGLRAQNPRTELSAARVAVPGRQRAGTA